MQIIISPHILLGIIIGILTTILVQHTVKYISHLDFSLDKIVNRLNLQWSATSPSIYNENNQLGFKGQRSLNPAILPTKVARYFHQNSSNHNSQIINRYQSTYVPQTGFTKKPSFIRAQRQNLLLRLQLLNKRLLEADIVQNTSQYQDILQSIILIQSHLEELNQQRTLKSPQDQSCSQRTDNSTPLRSTLYPNIPRKPLRL